MKSAGLCYQQNQFDAALDHYSNAIDHLAPAVSLDGMGLLSGPLSKDIGGSIPSLLATVWCTAYECRVRCSQQLKFYDMAVRDLEVLLTVRYVSSQSSITGSDGQALASVGELFY